MTAVLLPFVNSYFTVKEGNNFHFGGIIRWARTVNDNFTWRWTAGFRQQYFGSQYILLVGMDWTPHAQWRIYGDIPQNFNITYRMSDAVRIGMSHLASATSYNISGENRYFRYNYIYEGLFMELNLTKNLILKTNVDYAISRRFEIYNDADKPDATLLIFQLGTKPTPLSKPLEKGLLGRLGLSYRVF